MKTDDLMTLIAHPDAVEGQFAPDLKVLTERYPYFYQAKLLWLKSLQKSDSVHFESQIPLTALYAADQSWLYFYLYPERKLVQEVHTRDAKFTGSYFDLLEAAEAEGGDARLSLKMIAERLKTSRALMANENVIQQTEKLQRKEAAEHAKIVVPSIDYFMYNESSDPVSLEEKSKRLIKEKNYPEAIVILNQLNLINPKKSIYFADQIRFLEKIIANSKQNT
jgi:hypothetical protein